VSDDRIKMLFGFCLLILISLLAAIIALGKVEENTSHGLNYLLGALTTLAGGFAQWAFSRSKDKPDT
jgi:hypothetical protein